VEVRAVDVRWVRCDGKVKVRDGEGLRVDGRRRKGWEGSIIVIVSMSECIRFIVLSSQV